MGKNIEFQTSIDFDFQTREHIALLALLNNLTANAVEAIEEQGIISIAIQRQEDNTVITICDTGKGISQKDFFYYFLNLDLPPNII
ncbi:ATP-binding protein [Lysinibacillus sp. MHQ-1]|nr:ATP-binding protein [Lysinibacillus sp. MHQ-1]